jgi:hypothetical protein
MARTIVEVGVDVNCGSGLRGQPAEPTDAALPELMGADAR